MFTVLEKTDRGKWNHICDRLYSSLQSSASLDCLYDCSPQPETESRLQELAATTGRQPDDLVEDAMAGYLAELAEVRKMLDGRYDDLKSGRVAPIDGQETIDQLRRKSEDRCRS